MNGAIYSKNEEKVIEQEEKVIGQEEKIIGQEEKIIEQEEKCNQNNVNPRKEEENLDYNMERKKRGICLIFNHFEFRDKKKCPARHGTDNDCTKLEARFGALGFKVIVHKDLTRKEIFKVFKEVSSQDHSDEDCFVCCILTHGIENGYLFASDREYQSFLIFQYLSPSNCPTLEGKPKIFIIQACRGRKLDDGVDLCVTDSPTSQMISCFIPPNPDFLVVYSSMSDHYSFRDIFMGSWLIQTLTQLMLEYYVKDKKLDNDQVVNNQINQQNQKEIDFLSLLTLVNQRIAFRLKSSTGVPKYNDKKQILNISHTLTKRIFFKLKEPQN